LSCILEFQGSVSALPMQAALWMEIEERTRCSGVLQVCFYRDKNSMNKFIMGKVATTGVTVSEPFSVATEWQFKIMQNPSQFSVGAW
jgi:hypothetical protein